MVVVVVVVGDGGTDGATDRVSLPPGSVKLSARAWIPPPSVTAQRDSALCLSAFLGQDDQSTAAAHTHTLQ